MGHTESKASSRADTDNVDVHDASHSELLRHYGDVHVDSGSEYSTTTNTTAPGRHSCLAPPRDVTNRALLSEEEVLIDLDKVVDSLDFSDVSSATRKGSRDLSDRSFPSTSTDRILEDYAEYANELINAPYHLQNHYTSNETVNSKFDEENELNRRKELWNRDTNLRGNSLIEGTELQPTSQTTNSDVYVNVPDILITDYDAKSNDGASVDATSNLTSSKARTQESNQIKSASDKRESSSVSSSASQAGVPRHPPLQRQRCVVVEVVENSELTSEAGSVGRSYRGHNQLPFDTKSRNLGSGADHLAADSVATARGAFNGGARAVKTNDVFDSPKTAAAAHLRGKRRHQSQRLRRPSEQLLEHVSTIAITSAPTVRDTQSSNDVHNSVSNVELELYDDVIAEKPLQETSNITCSEGSVKSLAEKFEQFAKSSRENSPVRNKTSSFALTTNQKRTSSVAEQSSCGPAEETEESIYEEYSFQLPARSRASQTSSRRHRASFRSKAVQTDGRYLAVRRNSQFKHKSTTTGEFVVLCLVYDAHL